MKNVNLKTKLKKIASRQPINEVEWIERKKLKANSYNPNKVSPPELELLAISILSDGWTQPLVVREDNEIVDGFHRYLISAIPEIEKMTGGKIPIVRLKGIDKEHQIMSTIRHNRARGSHGVIAMSSIVRSLIDEFKIKPDTVGDLLQMSEEEIERLYQQGKMSKRGSRDDFSHSWKPMPKGKTTEAEEIGRY